jgi:restriction system protein
MSRSGNLAEWQRHLAVQYREDERLARERRQQEKQEEKVRQQEHLESRQQAADEQTAEVQEQISRLDEVLTSVLALPPMSFDRLIATPQLPAFDPGPLGVARPGPDRSDFAPAQPSGLYRFLGRFLGGTARHQREVAQAQGRFEAAAAEYRQQESQRQQELAVAKAKYHKKVTEERARVAARNAYVARRQAAFAAGDAESVAWFARCVLKASRYPDGFPREYQVAYDPEHRNVAVEFELPPRRVVPPVRAYRYVQARDVIEPVPRPEHEIGQRYERLISCIALRTLHEITRGGYPRPPSPAGVAVPRPGRPPRPRPGSRPAGAPRPGLPGPARPGPAPWCCRPPWPRAGRPPHKR